MTSAGSRLVLLQSTAYLAIAWAAVLLVDLLNPFRLQERLIEAEYSRPLLWYFLFREHSPTEWIQWTLLAIGSWTAISLRRETVRNRWTKLAPAFLIDPARFHAAVDRMIGPGEHSMKVNS